MELPIEGSIMPMLGFYGFSFEKLDANAASDKRNGSDSAWTGWDGRAIRLFSLFLVTLLVCSVQPAIAASGSQPFVLHETFERQGVQNQSPHKMSHGIVGLEMQIQHGKFPIVQGVFPGTPAAHQGLLPGDQILAINGISTMEKSATEVDTLISDVPGERVLFSIQRGARHAQVRLTVVELNSLPSPVRSDFSGLFSDYP